MKIYSFLLILFLSAISAQEKIKPVADQSKQTVPAKEKAYKEFPVDKAKGMQLVSLEEQKDWKNLKRVALIVGVSNYPQGSGLSRLNFGASDSQKMASVLKDVGQFDEVVLLNDDVGITEPSLSPKRENILRERDRLLKGNPNLFLFYFSGHGFEMKGENVVTPIDTIMEKGAVEPKNTLNVGTEIIEYSKKQNVSQVMVFLDACRETLREGKAGGGVSFSDFPERIKSAKGVGIFVGTSPGGYSYEDGTLGGGVFTYYIVKGISGEVQNKGGEYVTFNDLKSYVETEMAEYIKKKGKNEQAPYSRGDYTGDFLLAVGRPGAEVKVDAVQYRSKSGDRVEAKRIYDSKGRKLRLSFHNISEDGSIYPASLDGISQIVFRYNERCFPSPTSSPSPSIQLKSDFIGVSPLPGGEGSSFAEDCFQAYQYDKQSNLEFRHAVRYNPNRGWEIRRTYHEEPGTRKADRTDKEDEEIQYQRLEFDFNGNPILNEYQGRYIANKSTGVPEERPLVDKEGIARVVQNFDLLSNKTLEEYYDSERKLKPNKQTIARTIFAYDSIGNPILKVYTNERGRQAQDSFGISKISYAYDYSKNPYGVILEKVQFGKSEEELAEGADGLSRYEYVYDQNCLELYSKTKQDAANSACVKEIYYRGKDNQFKGNDKKIAISKYGYDDRGRLIEENYFRKDKTPMTIKDGITKIQYKYDDSCWAKMDDSQLKLKCRETDSICKAKEELAYTCVNETRSFNSAGALEADNDGIAVYKYGYDSGCLKFIHDKQRCINLLQSLNINNNPIRYARERKEDVFNEICLKFYQEPEKCVENRLYYDKDGDLGNIEGVASIKRTFDINGNTISEEYFRVNQNNNSVFISKISNKYDEFNNIIRIDYIGTNNIPINNKFGFSTHIFSYDQNCILVKKTSSECIEMEEKYNADGLLIKDQNGIVKKIYQYNKFGDVVSISSLDENGKLKNDLDGVAKYIYAYDINCIKHGKPSNYCKSLEEKYNEKGDITGGQSGIARKIYKYDVNGNPMFSEIYNENGEKSKQSIAKYVSQLDHNGNNLLYEKYNSDGKLSGGSDGIARFIYEYDEFCLDVGIESYNCRTKIEQYGEDQKLKMRNGYAKAIYVFNHDCLKRSRDYILKNDYCKSYVELYDTDSSIIYSYKNKFTKFGEFIKRKVMDDLIGTKKWSHTDKRFRFEEKTESVKEKRTVKKEDKFEEEEVSFPVLNQARYFLEFPNPKGGEGKRKVIVELDKLYRPITINFE